MDIILIAGLWLPVSVWDDVAEALESLGHNPKPLELPGVDDASTTADLEHQIAAVLAAVDQSEAPRVVGHSAACTLAWIAADRRPEMVERVVLIGGFPGSSGTAYADFFEIADGVMPFPGWEPFAGPDSEDLDQSQLDGIASRAVPVPKGVARGTVTLDDDRRFAVPVTMICPEYSPDQAKAWIDSGDVPELSSAKDLDFVDIESGHWPMVTRPVELARIIADAG